MANKDNYITDESSKFSDHECIKSGSVQSECFDNICYVIFQFEMRKAANGHMDAFAYLRLHVNLY